MSIFAKRMAQITAEKQAKSPTKNAKPVASDEEIKSKGDAQAAEVRKHHARSEAEHDRSARQADWMLQIQNLAQPTDDGRSMLGSAVFEADWLEKKAPEVLAKIEDESGVKLKGASADDLGRILRRHSKEATDKATVEDQQTTKDTVQTAEDQVTDKDEEERSATQVFQQWIAQFPNTTVLLQNLDSLPVDEFPQLAKEKAKLAPFAKILAITDKVAPAGSPDRQIVRAKINGLNPASLPDATQFVRTTIFSSPTVESSVSEQTQEAIAREMGIDWRPVKRPVNASDLQDKLAAGRGTEKITEIRKVEEPPGSGQWVEQEVVIDEKALAFTEADPLLISPEPRVVAFPVRPGSDTIRVAAEIDGAAPITNDFVVPKNGALPVSAINHFVVSQQMRGVMSNRGLSGVMTRLLGYGDSALGVSSESQFTADGQGDMMDALLNLTLGDSRKTDGRFLTPTELGQIGEQLRWLTPGGDFGAFNRLDPAQSNQLVEGMFGNNPATVQQNMRRAALLINNSKIEQPSFEALYRKLHPKDTAADFAQLQRVLDEPGFAALDFAPTSAQTPVD